jgi:hypothetical protein
VDTSFAALHRAYRDCRRAKRNTHNALAFEIDAEAKLLELQRELRDRTYAPGRSICFVTDGPKPREVFAADFRDRVVHHLLVAHQARHFEARFIHDSYACRPGKGVLAASDRLMTFLRRATANGRRPAWAIKLDVASFFPSIDKSILFDLLCRREPDAEVRWLTEVVLFHDPTQDYRYHRGRRHVAPPASAEYPVPARKSLFHSANRRGLPIGNLTSQFWANVYLNTLDQFAKRTLGCAMYIRYVDDVLLVAERPETLLRWAEAIGVFLSQSLRLELRREEAKPVPVGRGIDFVGWRSWWNYRVVRRQTVANLDRRLARFASRFVTRAFGGRACRVDLALAPLRLLQSALASYAGHLRHGAAWRDWQSACAARPWLDTALFRRGWKVRVRWRAPVAGQASFQVEYRRLLRGAGEDCLLFVQVGRYLECYGPQRLRAQAVFGLRAVRLPRAGYAFTSGVPIALAANQIARTVSNGWSVALARRSGRNEPLRVVYAIVAHEGQSPTAHRHPRASGDDDLLRTHGFLRPRLSEKSETRL